MLICQHCGQETNERARVCPRCGSPLSLQFSSGFLQPPDSYRSRQYTSQKPPEPAYPAYTYYPPLFLGPHSIGTPPVEEVRTGLFGTSALILGVIAFVSGVNGWMLPIVGVICGIASLPLGALAIRREEKHGISGFLLGTIGLILGLFWIFVVGNLFFGVF